MWFWSVVTVVILRRIQRLRPAKVCLLTMDARVKKRIGMISCEDLEKWDGQEGSCKWMIEKFKSPSGSDSDDIEWTPILAVEGELPGRDELNNFDGFIVSGSHYSVNEDKQWIKNLERFVNNVKEAQAENGGSPRLVGLCFGHQLISKALGGEVAYNPSGRFVFCSEEIRINQELRQNAVFEKVFGGGKEKLRLLQSHGDAVTDVPPGSTTVASSDTCTHEMIFHGDNILTMQSHPELTVELLVERILPALKSKNIIDEDEEKKSNESFQKALDSENTLTLIKEFIKNNHHKLN